MSDPKNSGTESAGYPGPPGTDFAWNPIIDEDGSVHDYVSIEDILAPPAPDAAA